MIDTSHNFFHGCSFIMLLMGKTESWKRFGLIKISIQYSGEYVFIVKNIAYFKYKQTKLLKNEYFYEKNIDENNYSIQEVGWLGILFLVGTLFFSGLLLYGFIDGQADYSVIVAYLILIAYSGICTLHLLMWRV